MTLEHEPTVCQVPYAHVSCGARALIKGCFAPVLLVKGRLHKALGPISARKLCYMCMPMRPNKAETETTVHGFQLPRSGLGSCLGDMAVCVPDRGLVFESMSLAFSVRRELPFL